METLKGVAILIPSLNPDNLFTEYVKSLFEAGFEHILVVDDGSRDDCKIYFEQAKDMGAEIITHDRNYGKGNEQYGGVCRREQDGRCWNRLCDDGAVGSFYAEELYD